MTKLLVILLATSLVALARADSEGAAPTAIAQRLFDAMSAHDADAAGALFTPDAMLLSVRADGSAVTMPHEKWVEHLRSSQDHWQERMWNTKVLEHGSIAVVWGEYDFHLNGKFGHCGVDSFDLLKTATGWKIAGVMFTSETTGCAPSPLGPPAAK